MNNKRTLYIILFVILILSILLAVILIYRNDTTMLEVPSSTPISHQAELTQNFTLMQRSISPAYPYTNTVYNFETTDIGATLRVPNPHTAYISDDNFFLAVITGGEGNPFGLSYPIPEYTQISNFENVSITRVLNTELNLSSIFDDNLQNSKFTYYYTTDIKFGEECSKLYQNHFCGSFFLTVPNDQVGNPHYSIYCGVNNPDDVISCDKIVQSLRVTTELLDQSGREE